MSKMHLRKAIERVCAVKVDHSNRAQGKFSLIVTQKHIARAEKYLYVLCRAIKVRLDKTATPRYCIRRYRVEL